MVTSRSVLAVVVVMVGMCVSGAGAALELATSQPALAPAAGGSAQAPEVKSCELCEMKKRMQESVPWLKWGSDVRIREIYMNNSYTLNKEVRGHEYHWQRLRPRLWVTVTPLKDIDINARLCWEVKNFCLPKTGDKRDTDMSEAIFDNLNVEWKNVLGMPLKAKVGRQDITLGDGWLISEGTPLDGSRTVFFDAARLTYEMKDIDTAVDLIYINDYADTGKWLPPFNERHRINLIEQDEQGAVLYVTNKSLGKTQVDGYYIYKHDDAVASNGNNADIYTFGSRVAGELSEHWQYRAELAYQFGNKNGTSLSATGANTQLSYFVRDEWNNNFRAGYEYRSGDDNTNRSFDALWGRHRPWGGLYSTYGIDALDDTQPNRSSNLHRPYVGWSIDLTKAITLATDYNLLFADDNISTAPSNIGLSDSGCFRGQLVTALLKHTINEHVSEQVLGELFAPGDYYSDFRNDIAAFLQYQLVFSW